MERIFGRDISAWLGRGEDALFSQLRSFADAWIVTQLLVIAAALVLARIVGRSLEQRFEPAVRRVQGQPRLLRLLALLLRRTEWATAAILLILAAVAAEVIAWPRHAALIGTAAWLVGAWVMISVLARLIRNRTLGRLVALALWGFVALRITGTWDGFARALDSAAIQAGTVRLSLYLLLQAVVVLTVVLWLSSIVGGFVERRIAANTDLTPSVRVLVGKLVRVALVVVACAVALTTIGIDLTALTVFSGALGIGIGFGLQKVVSNFVSGIIILLDKSIKPGDTIAVGDTFGWVQSLRSRFVSVVTRDGYSYLIPNEDFITQQVVNWSFTDTLVRIDVKFGVSYASDPHQIRKLAVEAAKSVERVQDQPQPVCHMTEFGESSLDFVLRFWVRDPQNGVTNVRGQVLLTLWDAFKEAGVDIPYPYRQLVTDRPIDVRLSPGADP